MPKVPHCVSREEKGRRSGALFPTTVESLTTTVLVIVLVVTDCEIGIAHRYPFPHFPYETKISGSVQIAFASSVVFVDSAEQTL